MAKRKKLVPPSAVELAAMEVGFARETTAGKPAMSAPIAQVAADAAAHAQPGDVADRAAAAKDHADADAYRAAVADGRVIREIPIDEIATDHLTRDRMAMDAGALDELKVSISLRGVRLPIEVFALAEPKDGKRFGLLSGFRRHHALAQLLAETARPEYAVVPAVVREETGVGQALVAMVEENEIRESLSQYERGRVAALATAQGAFADLDTAVNALFFAASKAKRSKVRSFAMIHDELGDLLQFPQTLTERMGLRLASALRDGFGVDVRAALGAGAGESPDTEWALIETVIRRAEEDVSQRRSRGGRKPVAPKVTPIPFDAHELPNGIRVQAEKSGDGYVLKVVGPGVDNQRVSALLAHMAEFLQ